MGKAQKDKALARAGDREEEKEWEDDVVHNTQNPLITKNKSC
ncbi:hypothetical protein [Maribacter polysaccharolyticus]|nr:hypothetical protein [Maribacter polysaccharolyticus]MDE3741258.1 hypothetical protein [Maribacter polysaccharolyticus]